MGHISNYVRVLKAKLQDVFVIDSTDSNVTTTKSVTVEQIGDTICGEQVHSDLKTDNQTILGGINELTKDKNVADEYDDTATYNKGDVTIYGNTLYICNTNNTTGTFDPSKWTATTIDNVIGDLSALTTSDKSSLVGAVNEVVAGKSVSASFTAQSSINNRNVAIGNAPKANLIIVNIIFEVTTTSQPSLSHKVTLSPSVTIKSANFIGMDETDIQYSNGGYIDANGFLHWNAGLRQGVWVVNGYITYE